jgi:hypothetical protein
MSRKEQSNADGENDALESRFAEAAKRILDEPMRVPVPVHLRCPAWVRMLPDGLVSTGEAWGVDAEIVVCWPHGEPLLWWSPQRVSGALCVYNTRLSADVPIQAFAEGMDEAEIVEAWPSAPPLVLRRLVGLWAQVVQLKP